MLSLLEGRRRSDFLFGKYWLPCGEHLHFMNRREREYIYIYTKVKEEVKGVDYNRWIADVPRCSRASLLRGGEGHESERNYLQVSSSTCVMANGGWLQWMTVAACSHSGLMLCEGSSFGWCGDRMADSLQRNLLMGSSPTDKNIRSRERKREWETDMLMNSDACWKVISEMSYKEWSVWAEGGISICKGTTVLLENTIERGSKAFHRHPTLTS